MDIIIGFNVSNRLVICVDLHDYDAPKYNCSTAAVVNIEDSYAMAKRHHIKHSGLPKFIGECMDDWSKIINPTFTQVKDCFKEITECLLDEGCRFKIERTYGRCGHTCC